MSELRKALLLDERIPAEPEHKFLAALSEAEYRRGYMHGFEPATKLMMKVLPERVARRKYHTIVEMLMQRLHVWAHLTSLTAEHEKPPPTELSHNSLNSLIKEASRR